MQATTSRMYASGFEGIRDSRRRVAQQLPCPLAGSDSPRVSGRPRAASGFLRRARRPPQVVSPRRPGDRPPAEPARLSGQPRFVRLSSDVKLLDQIPRSGDWLFRWRGQLPLLMLPLFLLGLLDARLPDPVPPAVRAWQIAALAIAARGARHPRRRHRHGSGRNVGAEHHESQGVGTANLRPLLHRPAPALSREHAHGDWLRVLHDGLVPARHRRADRHPLPRAHRRARGGLPRGPIR